MAKKICEIIQDLLPLYKDEICGKETKAFVEEHLNECEECKEKFEQINNEEIVSVIKEDTDEMFRKYSRKKKRKKFFIMSVIFLLVLIIIAGSVIGYKKYSYQKKINEVSEFNYQMSVVISQAAADAKDDFVDICIDYDVQGVKMSIYDAVDYICKNTNIFKNKRYDENMLYSCAYLQAFTVLNVGDENGMNIGFSYSGNNIVQLSGDANTYYFMSQSNWPEDDAHLEKITELINVISANQEAEVDEFVNILVTEGQK